MWIPRAYYVPKGTRTNTMEKCTDGEKNPKLNLRDTRPTMGTHIIVGNSPNGPKIVFQIPTVPS